MSNHASLDKNYLVGVACPSVTLVTRDGYKATGFYLGSMTVRTWQQQATGHLVGGL